MFDKKNRSILILGTIIISALILSSLSPLFFGDSLTKVELGSALKAPSSENWFGTDALGRSVFARALSGGSETILPSLLVLIVIVVIGALIGISSVLIGGKFDRVIYLIITVYQSFPSIIFVISIVGFWGIGLKQTMIAIGFTAWTKYAYLIRGMTLNLKNEPYIQIAPMFGNSFFQTIKNYYLPSLLPQILTTMVFDISTIIMEIAGLSFIGLGAQAPSPEWGVMINEGRIYIQEAPWIVFFPCVLLILTILLFTKFGEAINTRFNRN